MRKIMKAFSNFFGVIWHFIDKNIIVPITKLIYNINNLFGKSGKRLEFWLSRTNVLLFISLFLAIVIFLIIDQKKIMYHESSAEILKSIPIQVKYNEEAYVIDGLPSTVDITLVGSKTDLYIAKQSPNHEVVVDLTGLKPGTHKVSIKYDQSSKSIEYSVNPSVATVIIYPKVSENKNVSYDVINQKALDSKLIVSSVKLEMDEVAIKGAEEKIKNVATVKALLDMNNMVTTNVGANELRDILLKAYDSNGDSVDVEIVPSKISATVNIASPSRELPIKVIPTGELAFGKSIKSITTSETKALVYGDEEIISKMEYLPLEVDVAGLKDDKEFKIEVAKPVGVRTLSVNNVTVKIELDNVTDKTIDDVKIEYKNLADGYVVQAASEEDSKVSVSVKGAEEVINELDYTNVSAYLDLSGFTEGEHEVPVIVNGTDVRVQYISKVKKVKIIITKK